MPRYYCDYCDTYLTHDSHSVRKQHNVGYKHKANVRDYYLQFEAQQNQFLIDQRVKAHLGGAAYNQMRPRLPVFPTPMMPPMHGNMHLPVNSPLLPGMRPPVLPRQGYVSAPGMPPMAAPPGAPSLPGQVNGQMPTAMNPPPLVPGITPASSGAPPMFTPAMYQANPAAPTTGSLDGSNTNTQMQASVAKH